MPNFNELVASLDKRGVIVKARAAYSPRDRRMQYSAEVEPSTFGLPHSWPTFKFAVYGRELDELAEGIIGHLPVVEPIIAAREKHRERDAVMKKASELTDELRGIIKAGAPSPEPSIVPNCDSATAMAEPCVTADDPRATVATRQIRISAGFEKRMLGYKDAIEKGVMTPAECRAAEGLPAIYKR